MKTPVPFKGLTKSLPQWSPLPISPRSGFGLIDVVRTPGTYVGAAPAQSFKTASMVMGAVVQHKGTHKEETRRDVPESEQQAPTVVFVKEKKGNVEVSATVCC